LAEKQSLRNAGAIGLVLWLLSGCASLGGSGTGNDARRQISFFYENPHAKTVCVVGSFNGWTPEVDALVKVRAGEWKGTLMLPKGVYQYMYVIDGKTWVSDPEAHRTLEDGFGRINGLLVVE
jgi:1,4-alpha-glucan branching enzyme